MNKKLLGAAALSASLLGGGVAGALLGAPLVSFAQESDDSTTTTADPNDESVDPAEGPRFARHGGCHYKPDLAVAAEVLGVSEDELRDALEDGQSIADVAEEQGVDVQDVIDALVADATAHIDDDVADGDLDAERAAALKENLPERIADLVNREGGLRHHGPGPGGFAFRLGGFDAAVEALGITEEELHDALRSGQSIADVADEQGVDLQAVIDALVADATARIDGAVEDGDLDATRAAEVKENLVDKITAMVNMEPGFHHHRFGSSA